MIRSALPWSFALLALVLLACGGSEEKSAPTATAGSRPAAEAPSRAPSHETAPAEPTAEATPAAPEKAEKASYPCIPGDPAQGARLYATYCASCHGPRGEGDGPAAASLQPKPARHADGALMNPLSNDFVFKVIEKGGAAVGKSPSMAPWGGSLSNAQIWDLVAFIRTLARPAYHCPAK